MPGFSALPCIYASDLYIYVDCIINDELSLGCACVSTDFMILQFVYCYLLHELFIGSCSVAIDVLLGELV